MSSTSVDLTSHRGPPSEADPAADLKKHEDRRDQLRRLLHSQSFHVRGVHWRFLERLCSFSQSAWLPSGFERLLMESEFLLANFWVTEHVWRQVFRKLILTLISATTQGRAPPGGRVSQSSGVTISCVFLSFRRKKNSIRNVDYNLATSCRFCPKNSDRQWSYLWTLASFKLLSHTFG